MTMPMSVTVWEWAFEPSVLVGLALLAGGYALANSPWARRFRWSMQLPAWRQVMFYLGLLVVGFALVSPLDHLADEFLFSAHMVQHLLITLVAPPLWLLGLPDGWLDRVLPKSPLVKTAAALARPLPAFILLNVDILIWHIPSIYQATLENETLHIFEHLTFMLTGLIGWWPVVGPGFSLAPRVKLPVRMFYLFFMTFPMTALAALITLGPAPYIPFYASAPRLWGLSVQEDQQLSGALMWVPGNLVYFTAISILFFKWFNSQSSDDEAGGPGGEPQLPRGMKT